MSFDYQICRAEQCTGCLACMNICPKEAISVGTDKYGVTHPVIQQDKCVSCRLCVRTCPVNNPLPLNQPLVCFAAQREDRVVREHSTSGGIAAALSETIYGDGGCVFGVAVENDGEVRHICAQTKEDVDRLRGSKYVQSSIGLTYQTVREKLGTGAEVLFVGTPCQIAGLKSFLGREYEKLYCVDLICHGVPPASYLQQHIRTVTKEKKVNSVSFRNPKVGFCLCLKQDDRLLYRADRVHDTYFHGFFRGVTYRENCYQCPYAGQNRCADMTIGDFWGIDRKTLRVIHSGYISVVLVNTQKGQKLFDRIKEDVLWEERAVSEAVAGNAQLQHPSIKHPQRETFLLAYRQTGDYDQAFASTRLPGQMKREAVGEWVNRIRSWVKWKISAIWR